MKDIYSEKYTYLEELNLKIICAICAILNIKTRFICSKNINTERKGIDKNEDLIVLCKSIGADYLYDAKGSEAFLDKNVFFDNGVEIQFQDFRHPDYSQLWGTFQPYLSVIDLLFNEGDRSWTSGLSAGFPVPSARSFPKLPIANQKTVDHRGGISTDGHRDFHIHNKPAIGWGQRKFIGFSFYFQESADLWIKLVRLSEG